MTYTIIDRNRLSEDHFIPNASQWLDADDIQAFEDVLERRWITQGPKVSEFESKVAEHCGARYAVAVATGTAALHCAAFAAGVEPGDEVITSPITFVASANCVAYLGARPIFADIDPDTLNCDPNEIEKNISPRTKAIIPVDFSGHPAEMDEIMSISQEHGLTVISDAAHSLGAEYRGKTVGAIADMTVLSFHPVKHITTGEGGMIITDNPDLYERLLLFRTHGITNRLEMLSNKKSGGWYYEMQALGYNYRITDIQCALGISQLAKLDRFVSRRREIAHHYDQAFSGIPEVILPVERPYVKSSYHLYVLQFDFRLLSTDRTELFDKLRARNIGVHVHYIPAHLQPYYKNQFGYQYGDYPYAERYYDRCLTIPLYPRMTDMDVQRVIDSICEEIDSARL